MISGACGSARFFQQQGDMTGKFTMAGLKTRSFSHEGRVTRIAAHVRKEVYRSPNFETKVGIMTAQYPIDEGEEIADLLRILTAKPKQFRLQFFGVADGVGSTVQNETNIWVPDVPTAVRMAVDASWPAGATGSRIVDDDGRTVFERLKGGLSSSGSDQVDPS
jgi:hypothetical protein